MEAIRLVDILTRPVFRGCKVVAGESGLCRTVRWVHILEVSKTKNLLDGGELVLTTGAGFTDIEIDFLHFVEQLIEGQVSALCIELGTKVTAIPKTVIDFANQHRFPILSFSMEVRFLEITQDIHNLIFQLQHKRLIQERQVFYEQEYVDGLVQGRSRDVASRATQRDGTRWSVIAIAMPHVVNDTATSDFDDSRKMSLYNKARLAFHKEHLKPYISIRSDGVTAIVEHEFSDSVLKSRIAAVVRCLDAADDTAHRHGALSKVMAVGVGRSVTDLSVISKSHSDAFTALAIAQTLGSSVPLFYSESGIYRWTHLLLDNEIAADIARSDLYKVMKYDSECHTDLLRTLKVYLDSDRSKQLTSDRLFIHRQTLYHRLETLEHILQVDLEDPIQRLSLHVSLYYAFADESIHPSRS